MLRQGAATGVVAVLAGLAAGRAVAQPAQDPRAIEARKACAAGEVDRGIELLADYLATTEDITAIYNMGRCYQQNGMPDKALLQFREYRRKGTSLTAEERKDVAAQIEELEAEQRRTRGAAPFLARPGPITPGAPDEPGSGGNGGRQSTLRTAGVVAAAAGVASLGAAVYFGLRARSLEARVTDAGRYDPSDDQAGRTAQSMQWVMYGVGAAALVAGGVLYYLGVDRGPRVAVLPALASGAAGAILQVRL
jgi:hypothetical protein